MRIRTFKTAHNTTVDGSIAVSNEKYSGVHAVTIQVSGQRAATGIFTVSRVTLCTKEARLLADALIRSAEKAESEAEAEQT